LTDFATISVGPAEPETGHAISSRYVFVLTRDHKLYRFDLRKPGTRLLLEDSHLRSFTLAKPPYLAVRTEDAVLLMNDQGEVKARYPIPEALRARSIFWAEKSRDEALLHSYDGPTEDEHTTEIYWVKPTGEVRQQQVTLKQPSKNLFYALAGIMLPIPLVLDGAGLAEALLPIDINERSPNKQSVAEYYHRYRYALLMANVVGLCLAVLCYKRQVRYAVRGSASILWPVFVFLLGFPGWIGYRFSRTWPLLERCPHCGAVVPRNRETCIHCAIEFPRPALRGIEVYA
jgi:hypothetical protein